jgi:hypothetical protein
MSSSFIKVAMPRKILRPVSRLSAAMPESAAPQAMPHRSWVSPIRVGFVVHVMQVAGAEVLVRETIRRLGSALQPTVFCLDSVGTIGEQLRAEGVEVVCLHRRPGWDLSVSRRLAMAIRERWCMLISMAPFFTRQSQNCNSGAGGRD